MAGQSNGSGAASSSGGSSGSGTAGFFGGGYGGYEPAVCGDGQVGGYEQCDDGNLADGDGCDSGCVVEPGYVCSYYEPCHVVACGDGRQDYYPIGDGYYEYEQCDDGNTANGDGCSSTCEGEPGFICNYPGEACKDVVCGDGSQDSYYVLVEGSGGTGGTGFGGMAGSGPTEPYIGYSYEGCDDGNTTNGDGCNTSCETEAGWTCDTPGQPCRQPRCGDGYIDFVPGSGGSSGSGGSGGFGGGGGFFGTYEECDDANVTSGDGCSTSCTLEPGYSCPYGGPCKLAVCGDGIVDYPVESCDDGNTVDGDYCTSTCQYDYGGYGGTSGSGPAGGFGGEATAGTGGTAIGGSPGAGMGPQGGRMSRGG